MGELDVRCSSWAEKLAPAACWSRGRHRPAVSTRPAGRRLPAPAGEFVLVCAPVCAFVRGHLRDPLAKPHHGRRAGAWISDRYCPESGSPSTLLLCRRSARTGLMQYSKTVPFATSRAWLDEQPRVGLSGRFFSVMTSTGSRANCSSMGRTDPHLGISHAPDSKLGREECRRPILTLLAGLPIGRSPPRLRAGRCRQPSSLANRNASALPETR